MKDGISEDNGIKVHDLVKRVPAKLKPCPFCGEKTGSRTNSNEDGTADLVINCNYCNYKYKETFRGNPRWNNRSNSSDWIKVNDGLPVDEDDLLPFYVVSHGYSKLAVWDKAFKKFKVSVDKGALFYGSVTHWMPPPNPPEVIDDGDNE